jgi:diguanylate cyclase (GGDEF)-like protein/putative nucleotidyltransferase with HDIG domain
MAAPSPAISDLQTELQGPLGRRGMARTLGWFFLAAATLAIASAAFREGGFEEPRGLVFVAAASYVCGLVLLLGREKVPEPAIPGFLTAATLLITGAILLDGSEARAFALFYVWIGVEAFAFLSRRGALLQLALIAAAYPAASIALGGAPEVSQHWIVTVGVAALAGVLVMVLKERLFALVWRLSDAARTDSLTGLENRRAFEERLELELERARRTDQELSVLVGDIDGFKSVNDTLGHGAGDAVLHKIASLFVGWSRRIDSPARIGGEEFAVIAPATSHLGALALAERMRKAVEREFSSERVPVTVSFGIATYPGHAQTQDRLMRTADEALYAAKQLGRNRAVIYSSDVAGRLAEAGARGEESQAMQLATLLALAEALDIRDMGTARHSETVGRYAEAIARELGFDAEKVERVRVAGVLHDVGKIGIPDRILTKPEALSEDEWAAMHTHPEIGARLLDRPEFADLRAWILAHHERPDGTGYPYRLRGDQIPLEAKILAVADAYEAMTADRVYREAMALEAARRELEEGAGQQFDPTVVEAFLRTLDPAEPAGELVAAV